MQLHRKRRANGHPDARSVLNKLLGVSIAIEKCAGIWRFLLARHGADEGYEVDFVVSGDPPPGRADSKSVPVSLAGAVSMG